MIILIVMIIMIIFIMTILMIIGADSPTSIKQTRAAPCLERMRFVIDFVTIVIVMIIMYTIPRFLEVIILVFIFIVIVKIIMCTIPRFLEVIA